MDAEPIERVPCDAWTQVLEHGCLEEALKAADMTEAFERACCVVVRRKMVGLRNRLACAVSHVYNRLKDSPPSFESLRLYVLKTMVLLRYLVCEMNILFSLVWGYSEHVKAWIFLSPHLLPVLTEFDNLLKSSVNLDIRREEFTTFNMRLLLNNYHEFLRKYDSELIGKLVDIKGSRNFEIEALDILLCCPSINCQLSLSCDVGEERLYDISSFFGVYNLKPVFQVPDVHNSSLTTEMKKGVILRYLRECVQWENLTFLQNIISDITELEFRISLFGLNDDLRFELIMRLSHKYETFLDNPYPTLHRNISLCKNGKIMKLNENYNRFASYNANMTGLSVYINIYNLSPENLPLVIHNYRGEFRPLVDERILDSNNVCRSLLDCASSRSDSASACRHSIQICIYYREGFHSSPAESIIDVVYDEQNKCHISSNYIESIPFQRFTEDSTDED